MGKTSKVQKVSKGKQAQSAKIKECACGGDVVWAKRGRGMVLCCMKCGEVG